jgi:molybdopterin-guanine dinucleotide biosynthesis protein A
LVTNSPEVYARFGLETVGDRWPDCGALGGLGTAIWKARTERALVLACDLPFVTTALLGWLCALDPGADVTVCETEAAGLHPLCAVYSKRCMQSIGRAIGARKLKVSGFFEEVTVRTVREADLVSAGFSPDLLSNLNTREDHARARRALGGDGGARGLRGA